MIPLGVLASARVAAAGGGITDPTDLADLGLWIDATTLSYTDGAEVLACADSSGSTTLAPSTGSRPIYRATGVSGGPGIEFGSDQYLTVANADMARNVPGLTVIAAVKNNTTAIANGAYFKASTTAAATSRIQAYRNGSELKIGGRRLDADGFQSATSASGIVSTTTPQVLSWVFDFTNTDALAYKGGTLAASNTSFQSAGNTSDTASALILVGSTLPSTGYQCDAIIGEMVVYRRALTGTERAQVETYLATKWSIA